MVLNILLSQLPHTLRVAAVDGFYYAGIFSGSRLVSSRARISFEDDELFLRFSGRRGLAWLVDELAREVQ